MAGVFGPQRPNWLFESTQQFLSRQRPPTSLSPSCPPPVNMYFNGVYYPNWRIYKNQPPSSLNLDVISHVFYAFAWVKTDGTIYLSDEWADSQIDVDGVKGCLNAFAALKKKYTVLRVILSVGGGGKGSETFAEAARTPASRERFAQTARDLCIQYNLDGIDIDWEHPADPQQGNDYVQLLATLRAFLPAPRFTLSSALPAGEWALRNINLANAAQYLDLINLMSYDFSGPWVKACGHHAQLYTPQVPHNDDASISCHSAVAYILKQGVSPNKLLLGVPAYGRSFLNTHGVGHPFSGTAGEEGTFEYKDLPRPGTQELVDEQVGAAYCVGGDGGFITYDNPQTVKMKANYAKQNGLAGLFYWTGTGDSSDTARSLAYNGYIGLHQ
ncbi:chitinase 1 precursor [Mytilinidion resinicola]|uniref:chitinase n=1 Tax=Mytilinidion resinicola TaxID=574789 RepID=A0A6A6YEU0_9PEZI|nr:chitinase 1 precursor [Mytilinidion resinicola]KAF2807043.1 chitinase 1 precursor [Mytilinidion resinicola]